MIEIHAAVESLLDEQVSRSTVREALSAGVTRSEFRRVARGRYVGAAGSARNRVDPARASVLSR
jgi:hypothetical protein